MLEQCIEKILTGPWRFIQLRGELLSPADIDRGDVDLLGNMESIEALFTACYQWVAESLCHIHIGARKFGKRALIFYSCDGTQRLVLDLWYSLPQLKGTSIPLVYDAIKSQPVFHGQSVARFPIEVEASVYLHHLAKKKRTVSDGHNRQRLDDYSRRCNHPTVAACLNRTLQSEYVDDSSLSEVLPLILDQLDIQKIKLKNDCRKSLRQRANGRLLCIMGCDGVGKTSLANGISMQVHPQAKSFRGKRLYRHSLCYKFSVWLLRKKFPLREQFDETFVFFIYLRACFALNIKRWLERRRLVLIDRNLVDFLLVKRKTNTPRWSVFYPLSSSFGKRIPTVHCIASFETVSERKQEMTEKGHALYDKLIFDHLAFRSPTEYTLFNNNGTFKDCQKALLNIVFGKEYPLSPHLKVRKNSSQ